MKELTMAKAIYNADSAFLDPHTMPHMSLARVVRAGAPATPAHAFALPQNG
jgi:hypothetical protein